MEIIDKRHIEFLWVVRQPKNLTRIAEIMGIKQDVAQKIFNTLEENFLVTSQEEGRIRTIKINKNGEYYLTIGKKVVS